MVLTIQKSSCINCSDLLELLIDNFLYKPRIRIQIPRFYFGSRVGSGKLPATQMNTSRYFVKIVFLLC